MKAGLPPLIRLDLTELRAAEGTAGAMLEAMAERRPFSDVKSRRVTILGFRNLTNPDDGEVFTCSPSGADIHT